MVMKKESGWVIGILTKSPFMILNFNHSYECLNIDEMANKGVKHLRMIVEKKYVRRGLGRLCSKFLNGSKLT